MYIYQNLKIYDKVNCKQKLRTELSHKYKDEILKLITITIHDL